MNYTIKELNKYGVKIADQDIENGLIQLGHEVEEVLDLNIPGLVVGQVIECDKHPNSDKLSLTKVDTGTATVQIVCGAPNVRTGLKVIVATEGTYIPALNLTIAPVELRGEASNGMLCSLSELGLEKSVLNSKDIEGICELPSDAPVGTPACEYLGLDDKILDVSLTADRGDCQNYAGVVNDLKALINNQARFAEFKFEGNLWAADAPVYQTEKQVACNVLATNTIYYSTQLIENVTITDSSIFEQIFLMKNGVKPQNNIVDNSNYGLLTYGIPTHAFDADKIVGTITVTKTTEAESFVGLDGNEYNLNTDTLVIRDEEKIVAVAGVMGSDATKITDQTTNVLFELAIFDPTEVRLAAKELGFKTDASIRYEKGVNYDAINVTRKMLVANFGGEANTPYIGCDQNHNFHEITLEFAAIKRVLGIDIDQEVVKSILADLMFTVKSETDTEITYIIPAHRHDVHFANDLVEEVIRVYGIDQIEISDHLPSFNKITNIHDNTSLIIERKLEAAMLANGMSQVVTYSLISEDKLALFNTNPQPAVKLAYPISNERSVYRQSLINSLVETAKYNLDRQMTHSCIFEIADTYTQDGEKIIQKRLVSGLLTGLKENMYLGAKRKFDFYDLKSMLVNGLNELVSDVKFEAVDLQLDELNKYATANVYVGDELLGYIATVHPAFVKKAKHPIFVFELDFDKIVTLSSLKSDYMPVTNAPAMDRDLTITTPEEVTYGQLSKVLDGVKYIDEVKLIDIYAGENIERGFKAFTVNIRFAINGQTLTSEMVEVEVEKIITNINNSGYKFKEM
ncbi:phenylalanine--tRNA ligase subunit beta [Mollicutes bacterium LVI A0039]|nr:phenylalanine--tRNA ligase subunit beta [Mollicutes bacterium LVI A0039]